MYGTFAVFASNYCLLFLFRVGDCSFVRCHGGRLLCRGPARTPTWKGVLCWLPKISNSGSEDWRPETEARRATNHKDRANPKLTSVVRDLLKYQSGWSHGRLLFAGRAAVLASKGRDTGRRHLPGLAIWANWARLDPPISRQLHSWRIQWRWTNAAGASCAGTYLTPTIVSLFRQHAVLANGKEVEIGKPTSRLGNHGPLEIWRDPKT